MNIKDILRTIANRKPDSQVRDVRGSDILDYPQAESELDFSRQPEEVLERQTWKTAMSDLAPRELSPSQRIAAELDAINRKDYSIKKLPDGTVIRGADRDPTFNWKDILRSAGLGALKGLATGGIGGALGGAIGGTVAGSIDRNFDNKLQDEIKTNRLLGRYQQQAAIEDDQLGRRIKEKQIENTDIDNELNRQRIADLAEYRREKLRQGEEKTEEDRVAKARSEIYKGQYFDPLNPAHRAQAQAARLDPDKMPKVDRRNPVKHTIGDTTYVWNTDTRSFEDSGLPKDKSKSLVEYTVVDPNTGVETTYTTTSEKAASLKQSFANAGMQIKAANERQDKQIRATADENEKNRKAAMVRQQASIAAQRALAEYNAAVQAERQAKTVEERRAAQERARQYREELIRLQKRIESGEEEP